MKNDTYVEDISKFEGQDVTISGWLYNRRSSGKLHFLLVRDGTGTIQAVVSKADVPESVFDLCDNLPQESSILVTGKVVADKRSPIGYEIQVKNVELVQSAEEYPITPKEHGIEFLMDLRHLWLRSSKQHAILRVRHAVIRACRDFFDGKGFTLVDAPIFTPAACEGTTTLFETDYFGSKAYLTQSGQLYMEAAAMAFGKVYCFGPTFRAEKSKTRRHLTEFWMIEPEMAYCDLDGDMDIAEEFVEYVVQTVIQKCASELKVLERDISKLETVKRPFPRISYDEAVEIIKQTGLEFQYGNDFGGTDETVISEKFDRPIMVHRYPAAVKAFYMKNDPNDPTKALCVDVLAPEGYGEIIGGGQREDDLTILTQKIQHHNLPMEAFDWYLDIRKYGSVPHAGFGMGIERTVAWICGLKHIREAIPFPRTIYRLKP
ncbi:MAG: asparagine--tRNA ligase [candidate division KSB1 bacterium]|nr:asparagine--tRNA ligase [candidate division KSB1 bacterium]MDZ7335214.1 asparagine--tRNA ligase [candidate division KSB1 bacterium]MDZ7357291.1 asparagine--tRNA ligase [candidate division KSB1 bacterium]MDZ7401431.1 asparagine--tRNA ligase [candidate division KSB1 bacterium]